MAKPKFAKEIKKLRIDLGLTAAQQASMMCLSPSYLSSIETGIRPLTRGFADKILDFFRGCRVDTSNLELEFDLELGSIDIRENPKPIQQLLSRVSRNPKLIKALAELEADLEQQ